MSDRSPEPGFTPIRPNPYVVGNPVRERSMFFGRKAEVEEVRKHVQDSERGALLVFCGERRSGKTSILFQILDQGLGPECISVLIDMQSMAEGSELEFLDRLSAEILARLGPRAEGIPRPRFDTDSGRIATFQKFTEDLLRRLPGKKLVLLFDEYEMFEERIDAGLLPEAVLHVLASLMQSQPVFVVFAGSQRIEQRRRRYWNVLLSRAPLSQRISFLVREDALRLIQEPVKGRVRYQPGVVDAIHRLSNGQPFYTQAICQSLVERLNEHKTSLATHEILDEVVDGIVNNRLPQMIFQWDGLAREEKLVLAVLGEALPEEGARATAGALAHLIRERRYPLALGVARIATALEHLVSTEMLWSERSESESRYAFRMDLWRHWIRRQHSAWQVVSEVGADRLWRRHQGAAAAVLGVLVVALGYWLTRGLDREATSNASIPVARFVLEASPREAQVQVNGQPIGSGTFDGQVPADESHRFRLTAPGYADSEIVVRLAAGAADSQRVALRELLGTLRIETHPAGAEIRIDDRPVGRSPVLVTDLSAARSHRVTALLPGYAEQGTNVGVQPGAESLTRLLLAARTHEIRFTTVPSDCEIRVDGVPRGESPITVRDVAAGRHTFSASREGYVPADTTLEVGDHIQTIRLALAPKPPGVLVVQGDRPAAIYIDDVFVVQGVQHTRREIAEGPHEIRVVFADGRVIDRSVSARSQQITTYDFSSGSVTHAPTQER